MFSLHCIPLEVKQAKEKVMKSKNQICGAQLTKQIKNNISEQYKNIHQFSTIVDIPYTTLVSALKNGIGGTGFQTVLHICQALKIENAKNCNPLLVNAHKLRDIEKLLSLDTKGIENVLKLLEMEYNRCIKEYTE